MKNPLHKRLWREFIGEFGRYLVIFLFMLFTIGFISGFLVAGSSMITAYDESFAKYNIEYGHVEFDKKPGDTLRRNIEEAGGITLYPLFFEDYMADVDLDGAEDAKIRIYKDRKEINTACLMDGVLPASADEVALDRMFADNNQLKTGDSIQIGDKVFTVSGLVALPDYSTLFENNNDLMFDSIKFGIAVMTEEGYSYFPNEKECYNYAWLYDNPPANTDAEVDMAEDLMEVIIKEVYQSGGSIEAFVPRYANNAIQFAGEDMGSDKTMMLVLLYILIVIMAFVFAVTTKHTIVKESMVIGTLRASGYTKGELFRHYMTMPILVTLFAAVVGNVLGYTVFKDIVADLYYESYSLTTYVTIWNAEAFVKTTVVPLILMFAINAYVLASTLKLSPLRFIRRDLAKKRRKKALRISTKIRFLTRFRIRVVLQNISGYVTMMFGILMVSLLLLFGMMLGPLLVNYQDVVVEQMPAKYQYVLNTQVRTENAQAETYCMTSLSYTHKEWEETVSVYGISEDSAYIGAEITKEGVIISDGFSEKYGLTQGDEITLYEKYGDKEYHFSIAGIYAFPSAIAVFMPDDRFIEVFEAEPDSAIDNIMTNPELFLEQLASPEKPEYFTGYFSNEILNDIDEKYIASVITVDDMTKLTRQLTVSMGGMFELVEYFAIAMGAMLIYLFTKLILEKNANSISMVKILGYENREIAGLYLLSTSWVVVFSTAVGLLVSTLLLAVIYKVFMMSYSGWIHIYMDPAIYPLIVLILLMTYGMVAVLQFIKIKKIPMSDALKNVE